MEVDRLPESKGLARDSCGGYLWLVDEECLCGSMGQAVVFLLSLGEGAVCRVLDALTCLGIGIGFSGTLMSSVFVYVPGQSFRAPSLN